MRNLLLKKLPVLLVLIYLVGGLAACQEKEGPAEKAGKKIDQTMEKMGNQIEDARDKVKDATDK